MTIASFTVRLVGQMVAVMGTSSAVKAQDMAATCQAAKWDMTRELTSFRGAALEATAGNAFDDAPLLQPINCMPCTCTRRTRKSVQYTLESGQSVTLQLSDAAAASVAIVVELI